MAKRSASGSGGSSGKTWSGRVRASALGLYIRHFHAIVVLVTLAIAAWIFGWDADGSHDGSSPVGFSDSGFVLTDSLDVGDKADEAEHGYVSPKSTPPTKRLFNYPNGRLVEDDGRGYRESEAFALRTRPGADHTLVRRMDYGVPEQAVEVFADGVYVGFMASPGADMFSRWRDVWLIVPSKYVTRDTTNFTVKYSSGNPDANSFRYWMYVSR